MLKAYPAKGTPMFRRLLVLSITVLASGFLGVPSAGASPTEEWTQRSFTHSMQKPWNLSLSQRPTS